MPQPPVSFGPEIPERQRAAFADGKVTLAEYQSAFSAWEKCITDGGGKIRVDSRDPVTGVILFRVGARLGTSSEPRDDSVEAKCFHEYFDFVEDGYTSSPLVIQEQERQAVQTYQDEDRGCLVANGVEAPVTVEPDSERFAKLIAKAAELRREGKCPKP